MLNDVIRVTNVSKKYKLYNSNIDRLKESLSPKKNDRHVVFNALDDVSFSVGRGETIGIVGVNGSGKSTLLKIITGVVTPSAGNIQVNGKISALLELGAGFDPNYTGMQNIYMNGTLMGFTEEEMKKKVPEILDFASIGEFIHQPVKNYSSGMFARLAFAVATSVEPDVLIVDEALSVGDIFFQNKCFKKFEDMQKKGTSILLVTHDLSSVTQYCSRAILLSKGELIAEGDPKEIVDIYKKILVNQYDNTEEIQETIQENDSFEQQNLKWQSKLVVNNEALTYGDSKAEIIDFAIIDSENNITSLISKQDKFTIKMKVKFNETVENPIFAFTIKDIKGNELTGTNTMIEKVETSIVEKGQVVEVSFNQKMDLQGGEYLLSFGCTGFDSSGLVVYHRLYDVCHITVISHKNSVGVYDMNSKVVIKHFKEH